MNVNNRDLGSHIDSQYVASGTLTAGGAGDATKVTAAAAIDLLDRPSGVLEIPFTATLAEGKKLTLAVEHTDSDDNSTFGSAVADQAATTVATGPTGGGTVTGVASIKVDCSGAKRYRKYTITPDLDAANTDTARWAACFTGLKSRF